MDITFKLITRRTINCCVNRLRCFWDSLENARNKLLWFHDSPNGISIVFQLAKDERNFVGWRSKDWLKYFFIVLQQHFHISIEMMFSSIIWFVEIKATHLIPYRWPILRINFSWQFMCNFIDKGKLNCLRSVTVLLKDSVLASERHQHHLVYFQRATLDSSDSSFLLAMPK